MWSSSLIETLKVCWFRIIQDFWLCQAYEINQLSPLHGEVYIFSSTFSCYGQEFRLQIIHHQSAKFAAKTFLILSPIWFITEFTNQTQLKCYLGKVVRTSSLKFINLKYWTQLQCPPPWTAVARPIHFLVLLCWVISSFQTRDHFLASGLQIFCYWDMPYINSFINI